MRSHLISLLALLSCGVAALPVTAQQAALPLQQQRQQLLEAARQGTAALPQLEAAARSESVLIRRHAVRLMAALGAPARQPLLDVFAREEDEIARRTAFRALVNLPGTDVVPVYQKALESPSELLRMAAVELLAAQKPYPPQVTELLARARRDASSQVSRIAAQALWSFNDKGISLRDKPGYNDNQLMTVQKIPLSLDNWRFQTDEAHTGHLLGWPNAEFDDRTWKPMEIGLSWEDKIGLYDGVGWYRHSFTLPEQPQQVDGTDLVFEGVDDSAWVWINGRYVGAFDEGGETRNIKFAMDVSEYLKWGKENQITVRVLDRGQLGGIWKPVSLEVLKR